MSNTMRAVLGVLAVALAVVLLVALKGGDDSDSSSSDGSSSDSSSKVPRSSSQGAALAVPTIVVDNGAPVGGVRDLTYIKGDQIRFQVDSDVSDEIHVHGYDLAEDVEAGGSVRFDFPATLDGIFEVELEERGKQIAELRINP
jgi:hypothetical protein